MEREMIKGQDGRDEQAPLASAVEFAIDVILPLTRLGYLELVLSIT
jgi:hypothetical protein